MKLEERIQTDLIQAMKQREKLRVGALRLVKAALKNKEIETKKELSSAEANKVVQTLVKQRNEAIEIFEKAGRDELARKELEERQIIESYLPAAVDPSEVEKVVLEVIGELGGSSTGDMGAVMKESMSRLQATGRTVDGKAVSAVVRAELDKIDRPASS